MAIKDYNSTASNNTSISGIGIQGTNAVSNFDGAFRQIMADVANWTDTDTIASAATTDLSTVEGTYVTVSGTTTITALGTLKSGMFKFLKFSGALTLTHNSTSLILPGLANIVTAAGDTAIMVSEGSGNWRCVSYQRASTDAARAVPRGHIYGLTLSNNATDATNDIDIAAGEAASDDNPPILLRLTSGITKRLDALWAVGTGQGGLDTGAVANGTYHVWLIQRSDTGAVDVLFSASASSPTMPASYDRKRRIGSIIRSAGAILAFQQSGDKFTFSVPIADVGVANPGTSAVTATMTVPTGIVVTLNGYARLQTTTTSATFVAYVTSLAQSDEAPTATIATVILQSDADVGTKRDIGFFAVETNTSAQIRYRMGTSDANTSITIVTHGWVDTRGRLA